MNFCARAAVAGNQTRTRVVEFPDRNFHFEFLGGRHCNTRSILSRLTSKTANRALGSRFSIGSTRRCRPRGSCLNANATASLFRAGIPASWRVRNWSNWMSDHCFRSGFRLARNAKQNGKMAALVVDGCPDTLASCLRRFLARDLAISLGLVSACATLCSPAP